jgi:hypothetical protein
MKNCYYRGPKKQIQMASKQITLSDVLAIPKKDSYSWIRTRAFIEYCFNPVEVKDKGELVGYLLDINVRHDNVLQSATMRSVGFIIERYFIPKSHIHSFGRYTALIILYNPNLREAIIDPEQNPWHYEI